MGTIEFFRCEGDNARVLTSAVRSPEDLSGFVCWTKNRRKRIWDYLKDELFGYACVFSPFRIVLSLQFPGMSTWFSSPAFSSTFLVRFNYLVTSFDRVLSCKKLGKAKPLTSQVSFSFHSIKVKELGGCAGPDEGNPTREGLLAFNVAQKAILETKQLKVIIWAWLA